MSSDKVYSHNSEHWHDDPQDAINASIEENGLEANDINIMVGDKEEFTNSKLCNHIGSSVVEQLQCWAYDECGDWADDYLDDLSEEKIAELSGVILTWIAKNAKEPTFYKVKNAKRHTA